MTRDDDDDSTVKLRPVVLADVDRRWKQTKGFEIELDMVGDTPACSAKLEATQRRDEIDQVAARERPLRTLFSEDQQRLIREYCADRHLLARTVGARPGRPAQVGVRARGISTRGHRRGVGPAGRPRLHRALDQGSPDQAVDAGRAFRDLLANGGLDPDGDQQAKTRRVLEFFTGAD